MKSRYEVSSIINVSDAATDAEIREAIRILRAELLRRQRERASVKYLAATEPTSK